jgi:hypothetical protein
MNRESSSRPTIGGVGAALAVSAALLVACGGDQDAARVAQKAPQPASAAVIEDDPYAIACGHVRDQLKWADATSPGDRRDRRSGAHSAAQPAADDPEPVLRHDRALQGTAGVV